MSEARERCSQREPFQRVVERHGLTVLRVCRSVLGRVDADDAWSETFLAALQAYPHLDPSANVEAWLVTIAKRKSIDLLRSTGRVSTVDDNRLAAELHRVHGLGLDPAHVPETNELWTMVAALPERQRSAIAHHYWLGLPHAETAERTGSTPAAVRRAASDGVAALARRLRADPSLSHSVVSSRDIPSHGAERSAR